MQEIVYDIKDISDSREVMERKAPPPISVFLYIVIAIIIIALIYACIGEIDEYVRITGEIRPQQPVTSIITSAGGKLTAINVVEGQVVKKGDMLFQFDIDTVLQQKAIVEGKNNQAKADLENMKKLKSSIEAGKNLFTKDEQEAEFYYKYENYKVNMDNSIFQINKSKQDNSNAKAEGEQSLTVIGESLLKAEVELSAYQKLLTALKKSLPYEDEATNSLVYNLYKDYDSKYAKANIVYQKSIDNYNTIKKKYDDQNKGTSSTPASSATSSNTPIVVIAKEDVENSKYAMEVAKSDIDSIRTSFIVQIDTSISQLTNQISTLKNDQSKLGLTIQHLDNVAVDSQESTSSSEQLTRMKIKTDMIVSIDDGMKSLETSLNTLNEQLIQVNDTIKNSGIIANTNGVVTFLQELNNGDMVPSGSNLLKVMPSESDLKVILFVPESEVAKVKVGSKVEYIINSMPLNEYGKITGSITSISADSFSNEANQGKFYKAEALLDKTMVKNAKGEIREVKAGMITDARVISSSKKIIVWLLQKINLMD